MTQSCFFEIESYVSKYRVDQ